MKRKNTLMITCRDATFLYTKKKEGKLSLAERLALWFHLLMCKFCALFLKQTEDLEKAAHHSADTQDVTLSPEAKEKMRQALLNEGNN